MRIAILLATGLCLLAGCKFETGATTTITNVSIDGRPANVTRSFVHDGDGEFDCIKSVTGQCHYLLFVRECGTPAAAGDGAHCTTRTVEAFTLEAGKSRHLAGLPPKVQQCVSHSATPVAPDCLASRG